MLMIYTKLVLFMVLFKNRKIEAGEIAQWVRALDALAEDLNSVSSIRMIAHSHLYLQFQTI